MLVNLKLKLGVTLERIRLNILPVHISTQEIYETSVEAFSEHTIVELVLIHNLYSNTCTIYILLQSHEVGRSMHVVYHIFSCWPRACAPRVLSDTEVNIAARDILTSHLHGHT